MSTLAEMVGPFSDIRNGSTWHEPYMATSAAALTWAKEIARDGLLVTEGLLDLMKRLTQPQMMLQLGLSYKASDSGHLHSINPTQVTFAVLCFRGAASTNDFNSCHIGLACTQRLLTEALD